MRTAVCWNESIIRVPTTRPRRLVIYLSKIDDRCPPTAIRNREMCTFVYEGLYLAWLLKNVASEECR